MVGRIMAGALCALLAGRAQAAGWSSPEVALQLQGVTRSDLFPGSTLTGPDRGLQGEFTVQTATRAAPALKLGLEGRGGAIAWNRFSFASYGWLGGELTLRRGGSQLSAGAEWTPHRVKFGDDAGGAGFRRLEGTLGWRQSLPARTRLRIQGTWTDDDYETAYDARDAFTPGLAGQLSWRPAEPLTLHGEAGVERTAAAAAKYSHAERAAGGGVQWRPGAWRLEAAVRSGMRRYEDAGPSDSNFRRRDQWIELSGVVGRTLRSGLELSAGVGLLDQASSRLDRNYTVSSFQLGLGWTRAGD